MTKMKFRQVCADLELTQGDVAFIMDVTPRTVFNWENGVRPVPKPVQIILNALVDKRITLGWLERQ